MSLKWVGIMPAFRLRRFGTHRAGGDHGKRSDSSCAPPPHGEVQGKLIPTGQAQGGEVSRVEVIERLVGPLQGCPPVGSVWCVFSYASGSDRVRKAQRESIRYQRESVRLQLGARALATVKYWKLTYWYRAGTGDTKEAKQAEWLEEIIRKSIAHFRRTGDIGRKLRRLGVSPLEYLAILQCFAETGWHPPY